MIPGYDQNSYLHLLIYWCKGTDKKKTEMCGERK